MARSEMIEQFLITKEQYKDCILFYRLGDFYEMFFDDAITCSRVLELTLTGKDCGDGERAPMCGIPHHAKDSYIPKLLERGYKVAICEQTTIPVSSKSKVVKREVVRIITPGTAIEEESLVADRNNYLMSIYVTKIDAGVAIADISTGFMQFMTFGANYMQAIDDAIVRLRPSEIICNNLAFDVHEKLATVNAALAPVFNKYEEIMFSFSNAEKLIKKQFELKNIDNYEPSMNKSGIQAVGGLLNYLAQTQMRLVSNIKKLQFVRDDRYMQLDMNTRRNLELTESMSLRKKYGSLLWLLDKTASPMGARLMRKIINEPLQDKAEIDERLDAVEELVSNAMLSDDIIELMTKIQDIERKCAKVSASSITPKEMIALSETLKVVPKLKNALKDASSPLLNKLNSSLLDLCEVYNLIDAAIDENASNNRKDGGYIKRGFSQELDIARTMGEYGKTWLAELEVKEKERTGIKNLKTGFNRVFGYYIEVSSGQTGLVPDNYIRKQTTVNSERYITPELKEMEYKILNSNEESLKIENKLYAEIIKTLNSYVESMLDISYAISYLDVLTSFASVSKRYNYSKPVIHADGNILKITDGRHPVVEALLKNTSFVPNDCNLDSSENRLMLITGPNMAGKSTFMRQVAVITLLAHIGMFVPANDAEISIVDRIFTRVGASDDLAFGQSTFMVEMTEVSNILNNATGKSLIILDEVGRGTSTYDGLSIAWALIEYLSKHLSSKTLFSTHYHELTELEGKVDGVKNYRVMVREYNDSVIFLHKIARGSANKSFGIEVAKLAGLPSELVNRSKEILRMQEEINDLSPKYNIDELKTLKRSSFNTDEIINVLKDLDMDTVSPLMAFGTLQNLVDKVKDK